MAKFAPGKSGNPKGCPKGAHHIGRPSSKAKKFARSRSLAVLKRLSRIADGQDLEQAVTENGETIKIPAPVQQQIKAGEVILKVAGDLGAEVEINNREGSRLVFVHPDGSMSAGGSV